MPEKLSQPRLGAAGSSNPESSTGPGADSFDSGAQGVSTRPGRHASQPDLFHSQAASVALYATPSYSSLYVQPEDLEPGPGTYNLQESVGRQQLSTKHSAPLVSLTAKHDKSWAKVLISKDHSNAFKARGTPGPGTYEPELVQSQARVRFGSSRRRSMSDTSFRAPGPVYDIVGSSADGSLRASVKFGKANRFSRDGQSLANQLGSTGPGQYEVSTVFDGVNLAKSFGASHRAYDHVRFPGSERCMIGRASPGPGPSRDFANSGGGTAFGRAERLPSNVASKRAPGPGAYENHNRPYPHSRNQSSYSFGRPQPRGRLDWVSMRNMHNSTWGLV